MTPIGSPQTGTSRVFTDAEIDACLNEIREVTDQMSGKAQDVLVALLQVAVESAQVHGYLNPQPEPPAFMSPTNLSTLLQPQGLVQQTLQGLTKTF